MPSVHNAFVAKRKLAKRFYEDHEKEVLLLYRSTVAILIIPAFLTAIGAIVERAIYGTVNRPNFTPLFMLCGGFIAAPFIMIRWFWPPKLKPHLGKLEFIYYVLFSIGFFIAIATTTVAGNELFYTGQHVRSVFGGQDSKEFLNIRVRDDVYDWLGKTFRRVYDERMPVNNFSRRLPGRLTLNGPIRLNQYRTVGEKCSEKVRSLRLVDSNQCYTSDEQDKSPYSSVNFTYYNPSYTNYVGDKIFASDITFKGTLGNYPLAGHWVLFNPNFSLKTVEHLLAALKNNSWIDDHTRMVSLDCTVIAPDFPQTTVVSTVHLIETTKSGLLVPDAPQVNFNYLDDAASVESMEDTTSDSSGEAGGASSKCEVTKHPRFFMPVYFAILPALVYTLFMHCIQVWTNWRKYLHSPFTYSELAWFVTVMLSISFRWRSIYFDHCFASRVTQVIYQGNQTVYVDFYEFLQIAQEWFESRRILGLALFLHLFNLLRFIVQIPVLSSLIRTLKMAFSELASFSLSFFVVFFAFVLMFYIIFSVESSDYQNIPRCIATLWLGMLGELSITPELWRVKDWTIPMIILFTFISVFVLLTVIIAIISDAHERSRIQREKAEEKRKQIAKNVLSRWRKHPFRWGRNNKQGQNNPGSGNASQAFSVHKHGMTDTGFAGVVDMAMTAKKTGTIRVDTDSAALPNFTEKNGASPVLSRRKTPEDIANQEDRHTSQVRLFGGIPDSQKPEGEMETGPSNLTARSAAKFLNTAQARRRHRGLQEEAHLAMSGLVGNDNTTTQPESSSGPSEGRWIPPDHSREHQSGDSAGEVNKEDDHLKSSVAVQQTRADSHVKFVHKQHSPSAKKFRQQSVNHVDSQIEGFMV